MSSKVKLRGTSLCDSCKHLKAIYYAYCPKRKRFIWKGYSKCRFYEKEESEE